jgi:hypothetical protein
MEIEGTEKNDSNMSFKSQVREYKTTSLFFEECRNPLGPEIRDSYILE